MLSNNKGYLHLILGPMFSGKSTKLFNIFGDLKNENILVIKHTIDKRYESHNNNIITHNKNEFDCISLDKLIDILSNEKYIDSKYILIDEGQFFDDIIEFIEIAIEKDHKHIYISGLNGDSNRKPFNNISELISIADKIDILQSKCHYCTNEGIFTMSINNKTNKILIGDDKTYQPVCRIHYIEYYKKIDK